MSYYAHAYNAWQVSFFLGIVNSTGMFSEGFVRAVRGGP